ncbi:MAG: hypothetical protein JSS81_26845 [Acidobacteria bacterium]|nr:hypothetical protein [Acidobacteriota bacterium]
MDELIDKTAALRRAVGRLREMLGAEAFDIVDRWDGDLCAVGVARRDDHGVLVYFSTFDRAEGRYFVSLELPSSDPENPYVAAGEFDDVGFDELASIVRRHLSLR